MGTDKNFKIYCAGPLFNNKEKEEMTEIATALEKSGFSVFLPHRDGFEFAHLLDVFKTIGISEAKANRLLNKAIFTLDVYEVLNSDGLILNINGRVPDEGATVEAGIAWNAGKRVVIYKNDARTLINGTDNPLLLGLSDFVTIEDISEIPVVFKKLLAGDMTENKSVIDNSKLREIYQKGQIVADLAQNGYDKTRVCHELLKLLGED
ncbi:MAG: nucleoside 2-deoxyribosyltransferase [Deltaproteobacteria bacterium]|nr:nucleoside 2-deoxyribosyltransferase [Deltaproteobacteria bacterium]